MALDEIIENQKYRMSKINVVEKKKKIEK